MWQDWSVWSQPKGWPFLSSCSKTRLLSIISYPHACMCMHTHIHIPQPQTPAVTTTPNKQNYYNPIQPNQAIITKYFYPHSMQPVCQEPRMPVPTWQPRKWELITGLQGPPIYSSWLHSWSNSSEGMETFRPSFCYHRLGDEWEFRVHPSHWDFIVSRTPR